MSKQIGTFVFMPINFFKHLVDQNGDHIIRIAPPGHLDEIVEAFYILKAGLAGEKALFFNDGYPVIALMHNRDANVKVVVNGDTRWLGNAWVCGGLLKNTYCEPEIDFEDCLVIRFYPVTFFKLFGINGTHFQDKQVFDLSEIAGQDFEQFRQTYYDCRSVEEKVQQTANFLSGMMGNYSYPKLLTDIQIYMDKGGNITVKDILDGYSTRLNYKWLERNFKKHLGISPQSYLSIKRFLNAYLDLDSLTSKDLLQIALSNGYYDDNHFIKDFRRFCGMPPKAYFNSIRIEKASKAKS